MRKREERREGRISEIESVNKSEVEGEGWVGVRRNVWVSESKKENEIDTVSWSEIVGELECKYVIKVSASIITEITE